MHYEINVSLNGVHFFATARRSITNSCHLHRVYDALREKFTPEQGYMIIVTQYENSGKQITMPK